MATGPKIVHKQFNSPIGLYSQQNIQETLNKHLSNLDNGGVGIDFNNPATGKPTNLANSAVLRMLEEEERNRKGLPKLDPSQVEVVLSTMVRANRRFDSSWPPECTPKYQPWDGNRIVEVSKGQKKVVWPPVPEANGYHSPQQHQPTSQQPSYGQPSPQSQYSEPAYQPPQRQFEPPPSTITLRPQPPVHQKPPRSSLASLRPHPSKEASTCAAIRSGPAVGEGSRGDGKRGRRQLAKGPACRPRKVKKDYMSFFAQHALNHNYPGYRAPPGTQHYEDLSGRSSY